MIVISDRRRALIFLMRKMYKRKTKRTE